jgi:hypothetical protein
MPASDGRTATGRNGPCAQTAYTAHTLTPRTPRTPRTPQRRRHTFQGIITARIAARRPSVNASSRRVDGQGHTGAQPPGLPATKGAMTESSRSASSRCRRVSGSHSGCWYSWYTWVARRRNNARVPAGLLPSTTAHTVSLALPAIGSSKLWTSRAPNACTLLTQDREGLERQGHAPSATANTS